jgi:transposase
MTCPVTDPNKPSIAFDHASTVVAALELSGKTWLMGAVIPGISRRVRWKGPARDLGGVLATIERWKLEATKAGRTITRVVLVYEAGRDGFWIARDLIAKGIDVYVVQPSSIPVERHRRRVKTDRIDLDMLLRTMLAWLRGEPRVCSMVRIPPEAEEDARRPGREREGLVRKRLRIENRIQELLSLHGIGGFLPRQRKVAERLEALRTPSGASLPTNLMEELRRLLARHRLISEQIKQIEAQRDLVLVNEAPNREERMIQLLVRLVGLGIETATLLVREALCRGLRDRKALAKYVGLTGTPFCSGSTAREQGIDRDGNTRVRACLIQLGWRWLQFQPASALTRWFGERTAGAKGRIRKIMIVAMVRKLLIALSRFVEIGQVPDGVRLVAP